MTTPQIKDPSQFAKLPAGTMVKWGPIGAAVADFKLLQNADSVGATGETGSFLDVTRLIDTEKKFMSDLAEGPDKEFAFIDDPDDADQEAFLTAAKNRQTVQVQIEFPNRRVALMVIVLSGWTMRELNKGEPMKTVVTGKQNSITRSVTPANPA